MARQQGVNVEKLQGGLGRLATGTDNHLALVVGDVPVGDVATAIANEGKGVILSSPYDAEVIGINAAYDANNEIRLYADIVEFFRLAPDAKLYLFNSAVKADLKAFLNQNKEIKGYGLPFEYVPVDGETPDNLLATINAQQVIINEFAAENRLIDFAILGCNELNVFTQDLRALSAPNVSVCIGCSDTSKLVNMGAVLGMLAVRKISENLGSVDIEKKPLAKRGFENYSLTDEVLGLWTAAYLSDGRSVESITNTELKSLNEKGFVLVAGYEGYGGYYFNNSHTCVSEASDFAFIENNRVWNKAARIIRAQLLPRVKGKFKKDPQTGFISSTTVSSWEQLVKKGLEKLLLDDDISGFDVYINPNQVVSQTDALKVKASVVADGIVHEFEVALGLTNNI